MKKGLIISLTGSRGTEIPLLYYAAKLKCAIKLAKISFDNSGIWSIITTLSLLRWKNKMLSKISAFRNSKHNLKNYNQNNRKIG